MKNKKIKVGKFLAEGFPEYTLQMMYILGCQNYIRIRSSHGGTCN